MYRASVRAGARSGRPRRVRAGVAARARARLCAGPLGRAAPGRGAQPAVRVPLARGAQGRLHGLPRGVHGLRSRRGQVARARLQGLPHGQRVLLRGGLARRHARLDPAHTPRHVAALAQHPGRYTRQSHAVLTRFIVAL